MWNYLNALVVNDGTSRALHSKANCVNFIAGFVVSIAETDFSYFTFYLHFTTDWRPESMESLSWYRLMAGIAWNLRCEMERQVRHIHKMGPWSSIHCVRASSAKMAEIFIHRAIGDFEKKTLEGAMRALKKEGWRGYMSDEGHPLINPSGPSLWPNRITLSLKIRRHSMGDKGNKMHGSQAILLRWY